MNNKSAIKWGIFAVLALAFVITFFNCISTYNRQVGLKNDFTQKLDERKSFYDKMWKVLSQKGQIAVKNDSSFQRNINIIMEGRKDAQGVFMKWITESNPNANYGEVAALYADLSRAVEAQREGFFVQEKYLQDIKKQHDNLLHQFPANMLFWLLGTKDLVYTPISSSRTDEVFTTGKDDDVKIFN